MILGKKYWMYVLLMLLVILFIVSPILKWQLKSEKALDILIMNKTYTEQKDFEQQGLLWVLKNEKLKKSNGKAYNAMDYLRFRKTNDKNFQLDALPEKMEDYSLIYLQDMYGIENNQSTKLKNGLLSEEITAIRKYLISSGGTIIAERQLLGSPTNVINRTNMHDVLNCKWTGWSGKFFYHMENAPGWLKDIYVNRYHKKWSFKGNGIVFVDTQDRIVVLTDKDLNSNQVEFSFTEIGKKVISDTPSVSYQNWFDIMESTEEKETLAYFKLNLNQSGKEKLAIRDLPLKFPAIINHENNRYTSYYFAGDFSDYKGLPDNHYSDFYLWYKQLTSLEKAGNNEMFYWKVYVPLMKCILAGGLHQPKAPPQIEIASKNGIHFNGLVGKDRLQLFKNGKWEDVVINGINIGMGKPGAFPGEAAITKEEYLRWFKEIGKLHANSIRVYTLHPPEFYEAFYEYNQMAKEPLYMFHGVWVAEETLIKTQDAFSDEVTKSFKGEIQNIIDVIHGKADIPKQPGHAYGRYSVDISDYLIGWILGIEWDPWVVESTNIKHHGLGDFNGIYFKTKEASPFEVWLAKMMEFTGAYETSKYNYQHMMSFTNWPTTDLLKHPYEPLEKEDLVSVNPNHIDTNAAYYPGYFASYHVYPYYPDFMNYDPKYVDYIDQHGEKNNFAGYLHDLRQAHRMPVIVAEFGLPASRGITHFNVYGKNQGHHSEQEQGIMLAGLFDDILSENYAGGLVFTWQDEWFKRTWNTMDYDNPDRRPYWSNIQTGEQYFGLLSFDPGEVETIVQVDGNTMDWNDHHIKPIYEEKGKSQNLKRLFVTSDEKYVYFRLDYQHLNAEAVHTKILLDLIDNQGITAIPQNNLIKNEVGFDFYINISGKDKAEMLVDSYYDPFYYDYGYKLKMIPEIPYAHKKNNGIYHPLRMAINKKIDHKLPDGKKLNYPFSDFNTGVLTFGNSNPNDKEFNSLADYYINETNGIIELRIPWLLLNVKDPSLHEIIGDLWQSKLGAEASTKTKGIAVFALEENKDSMSISSLPKLQPDLPIKVNMLSRYQWNEWEKPSYHERLKQSYYIMQKRFAELN